MLVTAIISLAVDGLSQTWQVGPHSKTREDVISAKGEVSVEDAIKACTTWLKVAGLDSQVRPIKVSRISWSTERDTDVIIVFGISQYHFSYNVQQGYVRTFTNYDTTKSGKPKPQRPFRLSDPINVKGYVNALARKLKCPSSYELSSFECKIVQLPPGAMTNDNPSVIRAIYEPRIDKYPAHNCSNRFYLEVDPIDGWPVYVGYCSDEPYDYNKPIVKVTFDQAKKLIDSIAEKQGINAVLKRRSTNAVYPERFLAYVNPNKDWLAGDRKHSIKSNKNHLRLAWVQEYFRPVEIWIDAETGEYLGGYYSTSKYH